jgi:hypothetical protein
MISSTPSVGPIERFMVEEHVRLDCLLNASDSGGSINGTAYAQFRQGLLQHIAMEEKVLLPFARKRRSPLPVAILLRMGHGAIAKLLVGSPTSLIVSSLRELLGRHNLLEEGPGALHATCDELAGEEARTVLAQLRGQPVVPVAKYYDGPLHESR